MATQPRGQRLFPALVVVSLLLVICIFLGQLGIPRFFPELSGRAKLDASLILIDIPVLLPFTVDLIWVPALFILLYTLILLVYPYGGNVPRTRQVAHRLAAVLSGAFILLVFTAVGGLIAWLTQEHLPRGIHNGLESLGMNANLYLPGNKTLPLHGNAITLLFFVIGTAIAIGKLNKAPVYRKPTQLTREQRMTPYQRMLEERAQQRMQQQAERPSPQRSQQRSQPPSKPRPKQQSPKPAEQPQKRSQEQPRRPSNQRIAALTPRPSCYNEPLLTLEPEAVNYRPM